MGSALRLARGLAGSCAHRLRRLPCRPPGDAGADGCTPSPPMPSRKPSTTSPRSTRTSCASPARSRSRRCRPDRAGARRSRTRQRGRCQPSPARARSRASTMARRTAEDRHPRQGRRRCLRVRRTGDAAGRSQSPCQRHLATAASGWWSASAPSTRRWSSARWQLALTEAEKLRPAPKFIVFCAFTFDPEAAKDIDETQWPGVTAAQGPDEHRPADRGPEEGRAPATRASG